MKIGIDLRFLSTDFYSTFVCELITKYIDKNPQNQYNIYTRHPDLFDVSVENIHIHLVDIECGSFLEQTKLSKIFSRDDNHLMLFFNHFKPLWYKWEYYTFIFGLKDIFFQNFKNYFEKYSYLYLLEKNLKNSKKIICFDVNTQDELIERFNLIEENIEILPAFFIPNTELFWDNLQIDIRSKFQIWNDFFLYSGWDGIEKNLDRLIQVFSKLQQKNIHYDLVFLGDEIWKNIGLRQLILDANLKKSIHFIDHIKPAEELLLYHQSKWVIYPTLYESFPLRLSNAIYTQTPILTSNLKNIQKIFSESVQYFSPISSNSLFETLQDYCPPENIDYSSITQKYNIDSTITRLNEIIR